MGVSRNRELNPSNLYPNVYPHFFSYAVRPHHHHYYYCAEGHREFVSARFAHRLPVCTGCFFLLCLLSTRLPRKDSSEAIRLKLSLDNKLGGNGTGQKLVIPPGLQ